MSVYNDDDYHCGNVQLKLNYSETLQILSDSLKHVFKSLFVPFFNCIASTQIQKSSLFVVLSSSVQ